MSAAGRTGGEAGAPDWQGRATLTIMRRARPPLPEELFEPLLRAAVYEPDPSHTQRHIRPALAAFGRQRVQTRLLEYLRTGTDYEIAGAADAWYCSWFRVAGSDADAEADQRDDLRHEFQATGPSNPALLDNLRHAREVVLSREEDDEPELGGQRRASGRRWAMAHRLTAEDVQAVVNGYRAGRTARELADRFAISESSVKRLVRRTGYRRRAVPLD